MKNGDTYIWIIKQPDSGRSHTLLYNAGFKFESDDTLDISVGSKDI